MTTYKSALAKSAEFADDERQVFLLDGRSLSVPPIWFPRLAATPEQRARVIIGVRGVGLHWQGVDEDLSVAGLPGGADWRSA